MYGIRFKSKVIIPGLFVRPYLYYPSSSNPTLFRSREAAENLLKKISKDKTYEVVECQQKDSTPAKYRKY